MKALHRSALSTAGLVAAFVAALAPSVAGAQRNQLPGPDTKRVLVTAFRGDVEGGVKTADEIRARAASEFNIRQLMPNPKKDIEATLAQSGYRPDSALSPNDIKELAKLLRADEVIDGTVQKSGSGYRVNARMFLPRDPGLSQPLVNIESNNLGDVAKQVIKEYDAARKQLPANQECENAIRNNKPADAIAAARRGIAAYPKATLVRLCLASAYQAYKTTADSTGPWKDSVIAITRAITALDKSSRIAYQLQYDAYKSKNDTANAMQALVGLMGADPTNTSLRESVIAELVNSGKADVAIPLTKQNLEDNPGDPQYARTYWQVLRAARRYKESVPAGQAYVALDSAAADSGYFLRQISDLRSDSAYAKAAEFAALGIAKYPRSATLYLQKAQNERSAGQLPAAKSSLERALQIDPKLPGVAPLLAQISSDVGDVDGAVKAIQADVAADPSNKERDAMLLVSIANQGFKSANASKKPDDWRKVLKLAQAADAISASPNAKFFTGVSAYYLMADAVTALQGKNKRCEDAKTASEMITLIQTNMPGGGSVDANTAKQILGAASQSDAYVTAASKQLCR